MPFSCEDLVNYSAIDCVTDSFAYNRVVAVGLVKNPDKDYTLAATWEAYVTLIDPLVPLSGTVANINNDFVIIKNVLGEYDGGAVELTEGYGSQEEVVDSMKHTANLQVEYNKKNIIFFNKLMTSRTHGFVMLTGNNEELHVVTNVTPTYSPKMPVTTEIKKHRRFFLDVMWSKIELPPVVNVSTEVKQLFF